MADEGPKPPQLSQQELARVLQRAAEIESREGPRSFSHEDAIAAGRELGLAPGTIEAVLAEHAARAHLPLAPRPFDTRVALEVTSDRLLLRVPGRGWHGRALAKLGGGAFMLAFAAFWTRQALGVGSFLPEWEPGMSFTQMFPLFSLPLWLGGAAACASGIWSMVAGHRLELTRRGGRLTTRPFGWSRRIRPDELRARLDKIKLRDQEGRYVGEIPVLALDHGTRTFNLMADKSRAEQRWVQSELERWLAG